jgi:hypothetical protein
MAVELVRIGRAQKEDGDDSRSSRILRRVRERPYVAAAAAPIALVGAGPLVLGSATAAAVAFIAGGEWRHQRRSNTGIVIIDPAEAARFRALGGDVLREGPVYARHPKPSKRDLLIPAKRFHQHIVNEQIADLVTYLRSTVHVSVLEIRIRSEKGVTVGSNGILKSIPLTARLTGKASDETAFSQSFNRPSRLTAPLADGDWLADFPHIVAAAEKARHGFMRLAQTFDFSFDLEIGTAKVAGIKADWLSTYTFEVYAEFA